MPRHFTQVDYNATSPSPHDVSLEAASTSSWNLDNEITMSHSPWTEWKLNAKQTDQSFSTPQNKSKPSVRESSTRPRQTRQSLDTEKSYLSKYEINMTRMEELFPDFTQGNIHSFSDPPKTQQTTPSAEATLRASLRRDAKLRQPSASTANSTTRSTRFTSLTTQKTSQPVIALPSSPKPVLPNLNELVSGKFQDGTPVFSPHAKPRGSRFVSASQFGDTTDKAEAAEVAEKTPPPFDEKKILASLGYLERKVAALERNRAQDEITIQQLQHESRTNKEKLRWRRSDSAIGSTDGGSEGDDMASNQRKLVVEKNRLETTVRALQVQVNSLNQAASVTETNLGNVTKDRDSAVAQLGVAYFAVEQLKVQNQTLEERNAMLKRSVDQLIANQEDTTMDMTAREEALDKEHERRAQIEDKRMELKIQKQRREAIPENQIHVADQSAKLAPSQDALPEKQTPLVAQSIKPATSGDEVSENQLHRADEPSRTRSSSLHSSIADDSDSAKDITYISFINTGELGDLRRNLENERIARSRQSVSRRRVSKTESTVKEKCAPGDSSQRFVYTQPTSGSAKPRRRGSKAASAIKDRAPSVDGTQQVVSTQHTSHYAEPTPGCADSPAVSAGSRHSPAKSDNMTSEWIVNDITLDFSGYEDRPPPTPSGKAEIPYYEDLPPVVFRRPVENVNTHVEQESTQRSINRTKSIPKPKVAAKRAPELAAYEEEPTLRPSQNPALALASVMKALEEELAKSKRHLAQYQDLYNNQNPALGKRARKSLKEKMELLLKSIDLKADHIYSLYDVLEGQKQTGQEMSNEELQLTLQSIGVETSWEGIDSTSRSNSTCQSRRSS